MNRKILFHYSKLNIGGAERSNVRLMNFLVRKGWSVELVLNYGGGTLESSLDSAVKITHLSRVPYISRRFGERNKIKKFVLIFFDIIPFVIYRIVKHIRMSSYKFKNYDVAVIGLQGLDGYFVAKKVSAKIKLLWIRNDLLHCDPTNKVKLNIEKYNGDINYFMCVSQTSFNSLGVLFPDISHKAKLFYNILDKEEMIEKSQIGTDPYSEFLESNSIRILTVCRIQDRAKGVFRMYSVYKILKLEGFNIKWFVIGEGEDKEILKKMITKEGNENGFILLGLKDNPFPYYKYADICATLSYYEGLCGTVNEAKIMSKCVIATEFSGIHEQLINMKTGLIVDNNEAAILDGMRLLLTSPNIRENLSNDFLPESIKNDDSKILMLEELLKK